MNKPLKTIELKLDREALSLVPHIDQWAGTWMMEPGRMNYLVSAIGSLNLEAHTRSIFDAPTRIFPAFQVPKASGEFGVVKLASLLANANAETKRGARGDYNSGDYKTERRNYITTEHGWKERIDDHDRAMYADFYQGAFRCDHRLSITALRT